MTQLFISGSAAHRQKDKGAAADPGKRLTILKAAARQFAQYGFRKTSITEIASEAGVAAGTMYLYFADKEDLFRHTVRTQLEPLIEELKNSVAGIGSWPEGFRVYALARARLVRERLGALGVTYERIHEPHPVVEEVRLEIYAMERDLMSSILRLAVEAGEIGTDDPELLARVFQSVLNGMERQMLEEPWERVEAMIEGLISMAWNGLRPAPAAKLRTKKTPFRKP